MSDQQPQEISAPFFRARHSTQGPRFSSRGGLERGSLSSFPRPSLDFNNGGSFSDPVSWGSIRLNSLEFSRVGEACAGDSLRELQRSKPTIDTWGQAPSLVFGGEFVNSRAQLDLPELEETKSQPVPLPLRIRRSNTKHRPLFTSSQAPQTPQSPQTPTPPSAPQFALSLARIPEVATPEIPSTVMASPPTPTRASGGPACRCKASMCLKLYCECFAKGQVCGEGCRCKGCHNTAEKAALRALIVTQTSASNPFAFCEKYKPVEGQGLLLHSRGCNCVKTACVKNYCECFNAGVGCSRLCKCVACRNKSVQISEEQGKLLHDDVAKKRRRRKVVDISLLQKAEFLGDLLR